MDQLVQIQTKFDLNSASDRELLAIQIGADIDAWCVVHFSEGHRNHLGASLIGHKCERYLWYIFRWCVKEQFNGRMLRLFNRGKLEEARIIEYLEGIGVEILDTDANQVRIGGVGGHFGGSRDGSIVLASYGWTLPLLAEFKTQGTGKGFAELGAIGVKNAKPMHYAQMCVYGYKSEPQLHHALYIAVNKNDDDLCIEIVPLDMAYGAEMEAKAHRVIVAPDPPPRLSNIPSFWDCKYCPAQQICHFDAPYERNCRSCKHSSPVDKAEWFCGQWGATIPTDVMKTGCDAYLANKL